MIRKLSVFDHLDKQLLEEARVESVLALQCQNVFVLVEGGSIVGLIACSKKGNRFWVERFYVMNIKKRLRDAYRLLVCGLKNIGAKKHFYYEVEKNNPKIEDRFFFRSQTVSENAHTIIQKRELHETICI